MIKFAYLLLVGLVAQNNGAYLARLSHPTPRSDGRIAGGEETPIEEVPYQLSLISDGSHICGASIISSTWCITAAHCVYGDDAPPSKFSVRAGSSVKNSGGSVHQVVEIIIHPNYDFWSSDSDYALLRVEEEFPLGQPGVAAIPLAEVEPEEGEEGVVSGWGRLSDGGTLPKNLQSVKLPIIGREHCQEMYFRYYITKSMLCAGFKEGGKDSCQGDAGGPLVADGKLAGIVSWGLGCAHANSPGVYANVAKELSWIKKNSGV